MNICLRYLLLALMLSGCATGPIDYPRTYSNAITDTADTRLGRDVSKWQTAHPGMSGFYPLVTGMDALGARLAMIDMAERSIDAQYFLIKNDSAGLIFVGRLLEAADRGVRVRVLLDDIFTSVDDQVLLLPDRHPNIEIRLFNPIGRGSLYLFNYAGNFQRANRRMHNKSLTADNQVSIVGGRNKAEEYFELNRQTDFSDLDVFVIGSNAGDIAETFDRYWNHALSVPMEAFASDNDGLDLDSARAEVAGEMREAMQSTYARAIGSELVQDLVNDRVSMFPALAEVITDDPDKLMNKISVDQQALVTRMAEIVSDAESEVIVITPYLIPGAAGVEFWRRLTERGIKVTILPNSLASTNHIPVHAAYARYRRPLVQAGVELYELRVDATDRPKSHKAETFDAVTLHVKAILVDRTYTFIGSLNLDPRSIDINTEMGVLVKSTAMAERLVDLFTAELPRMAYEVVEDEEGRLRWLSTLKGNEITEEVEPQASHWRRLKAFFTGILPESQL